LLLLLFLVLLVNVKKSMVISEQKEEVVKFAFIKKKS
jgi:hypothetical protein